MFEDELNELLNSETQAYSLLKHINNEEFENELIGFTKKGFVDVLWTSFPSQKSRQLVMLGLTFIALKYYDGALWPHVYKKYSDVFQDQKLLESKLRDNVLSLLTTKYNCERKHYQIPVMNAIVPFNYASNYIEFANDIYVKNMDCNISDYNIEEEIKNVFDAIGNVLTDTDDSFKYDYEQNNSKTYKLIRATKNIIRSGFKRAELILFTKDIIKKLDAYYNGKLLTFNDYIDHAFKKWIESNQENNYFSSRTKTNFIKSKFPYFTFLNSNGSVYLHTPTKRLFGTYDPKYFSMEILENEDIIFKENNLRINQILGGSEVLQCDYKIENPFNKIRCKIYYKSEIVYDSRDFLYRDYIIFDDNKELKNNKIYNGLVYFIYKNTCDNKLTKLQSYNSYKIAYTTVHENDEYLLDNKYVVSFSNFIKPGIIGEILPGLELLENSESIPIFKSISQIILISQNTNRFANKVKINGVFIELNNAIEIIQQQNALAYIIDFEKISIVANLYEVALIDIQQDKLLCKYNFLLDPNIEIDQLITSEYTITTTYKGSFSMLDKANRQYFDFILDINNLDHKKLYLNINGTFYKCKFSLLIPFYKIDDECNYTFEHNLTSDDYSFQSRLYFNVSNCNKVIYKADNIINELSIKTEDKTNYIELSELINYKNTKLIELSFISENVEKNFLRIYNDIIFNEQESYYIVDSNNEEVQFKTILDGKKSSDQVYIQISNRFGVIDDQIIDDYNPINIFKLGNKIQKIHYCVYRKIKTHTGFKTSEEIEILLEGNFAYYPLSDLINKYLVIDKVSLHDSDEDSEMVDVINLNIKLVKRFNEFYYLGFLYENKNGKIRSFDKINEVLINISEIYKINNNYCSDANISIFYEDSFDDDPWTDYLQYDEKNKIIVNGYSKDAPYITKYRINLTLGEKQYANFKSNRKS